MKERILGKITLLKYVVNSVVYTRHKKPINGYMMQNIKKVTPDEKKWSIEQF